MTSAVSEGRISQMVFGTVKTAKTDETTGDGFSRVLDNLSKKDNNREVPYLQEKQTKGAEESGNTKVSEDMEDPKNTEIRSDLKENEVKSTDAPSKEDEANCEEDTKKSLYDNLFEMMRLLLDDVMKVLDTDVGDMTKVMNDLGLTPVNILNPEDMQNLFLNVLGKDQTDLFTDEGLYSQMKELSDMIEDMVSSMQKLIDESGLSAKPEDILSEISADSSMFLQKEEPMKPELPFSYENAKKVSPEETGGIKAETADHAQTDNGLSANAVKEFQNSHSTGDDAGSSKENLKNGSETGNAVTNENDTDVFSEETEIRFENVPGQEGVGQITNDQADALFTDNSANAAPDTKEIMNQIMDYMKTRGSEQLKEVEMQLHPSELGSLHVSIVSKNGAVTAQFTAQNETVKDIVAAQTEILRENLEAQGVKVEAVEVTVESHAFERNLEEEAGKREDREREATEKNRKNRRISIDFSDESADENISEAEAITRDMMKRYGNSLDYLV